MSKQNDGGTAFRDICFESERDARKWILAHDTQTSDYVSRKIKEASVI